MQFFLLMKLPSSGISLASFDGESAVSLDTSLSERLLKVTPSSIINITIMQSIYHYQSYLYYFLLDHRGHVKEYSKYISAGRALHRKFYKAFT